ncbi:betaine--homocysteine S-methyltransferase 1-like isoform X1 [Patiria miniata]|uniref:Hcy-binding domain-containing protein n=1 Tax=Patiria miniata TaxID=46514 RepID=A0A914A7M0_PATMI|nr:betaine--homocysteine S-methyltransferase 1-like isoform X1 [Patiria miniata]XP_038059783.1 betaine--homocysteine S-methyltransferase 1-like isoform X1 [Patiria miniata]XP_038059784.1 betaine--homocysteine S-methyltransferase 1-like isoform X1 [Patiria miniata]XP_038059785.1 betaine--homocysteine S-methyltransferase 1-like isoform X1 [Patiria miniata]XP_038059786.1 betaine--homocysteine S-methyltransferase 1-like isoform X1 [Patiria miniata]
MDQKKTCKGLMERLRDGETVICAEGYLFVFERRGYLTAGSYVPEVVLEHPELVRQQYEEFVHAGSDVVLAFTYYAHREKMALIGREDDLERINKHALRMAREVADQTGTLMAGNISNTNLFVGSVPNYREKVWQIFKEQIEWAVEAGADFIVGETFSDFEEALMAVKACKEFAKDIPCVVTMAAQQGQVNGKPATVDGVDYVDAFNKLAEAGADVVGLNCARGPATMLPIMEEAVKVCKAPLAAVPVMYRTTEENPNFMSSKDPLTGESLFPVNLDCIGCNRQDIHDFGKRVQELGIKYVGLCCGNSAHLTRSLAESLGRKPPASRYSADLKKHWLLGHDDKLPSLGQEFKTKYAPKLTKVEK